MLFSAQDLDSAQEAVHPKPRDVVAATLQRLVELPQEFDQEAVESWKLQRELFSFECHPRLLLPWQAIAIAGL